MTVTADLPQFPAAAPDDALAAALRDPEVRASLAVIAANAPNIAVLVTSSQALLARGRDIADNINGRVDQLREVSSDHPVDFTRYRDLARALGESSPTIQDFLKSSVLQAEVVDVISRVGEAALEADRLTRNRRSTIGGLLALLRQLKDPQVQQTVGFFVEFAKAFGRSQASAPASPRT